MQKRVLQKSKIPCYADAVGEWFNAIVIFSTIFWTTKNSVVFEKFYEQQKKVIGKPRIGFTALDQANYFEFLWIVSKGASWAMTWAGVELVQPPDPREQYNLVFRTVKLLTTQVFRTAEQSNSWQRCDEKVPRSDL